MSQTPLDYHAFDPLDPLVLTRRIRRASAVIVATVLTLNTIMAGYICTAFGIDALIMCILVSPTTNFIVMVAALSQTNRICRERSRERLYLLAAIGAPVLAAISNAVLGMSTISLNVH